MCRGSAAGSTPVCASIRVSADAQRHHDLFERGVARALADAVDRALDLRRTRADAGERVRDREAEVVVAVDGELDVRRARGQRSSNSVNISRVLVRQRVADRVGEVDDRRAGRDRACGRPRRGTSGSERVASSAENSTSSQRSRAYATDQATRSSTSSGVEPELALHVQRARRDEDVHAAARCVGERATVASTSSCVVRASEATVAVETAAAAAATPAKSPGEDAAKPASITSTPNCSSAAATSAFSSGRSAMPGDCSPSLKVVSKIEILRTRCSSVGARLRAHFFRLTSVCAASNGRVSASSP